MATSVSLNHLRTARRRPEHADDALLQQIAASKADDEPGLAALVVGKLFGQEPVSTRVIATLHWVDGMTLEEVAREVGMSTSGVRKRLRALQEKLQRQEENDHGRAA
jgi:DNA-directed RNA polymerase specialized sigma24 family protein